MTKKYDFIIKPTEFKIHSISVISDWISFFFSDANMTTCTSSIKNNAKHKNNLSINILNKTSKNYTKRRRMNRERKATITLAIVLGFIFFLFFINCRKKNKIKTSKSLNTWECKWPYSLPGKAGLFLSTNLSWNLLRIISLEPYMKVAERLLLSLGLQNTYRMPFKFSIYLNLDW